MKIVGILLGLSVLFACETTGVGKDDKVAPSTRKMDPTLSEAEKLIEPTKTVVEKKTFPNGIKIQWFERGNGPKLVDGSVYEINFKVKLTNGQVVDGNFKLNRDMLPYLMGYQMQTKGMDLAMRELNEGDFVEMYIPGNLARGKKGIPGVIPPNAPNIIHLRVGKEIKPTKIVDGVKVWRLEENEKIKPAFISAESEILMHYFVGTATNPRYDNSYQRNEPFAIGMKSPSLVPGLKKGLTGMKMYDKLWILVPAKEAYGSTGLVDLVKPNEAIFYDLIIMDVDRKSTLEN